MEQQPRLPLWFLVVNWALIAGAFVLGAFLGGRRSTELAEPQRTALEIVYREVLRSHIDPQDEHELLERAIAGMVHGLDPYSRYVPPRDVPRYEEANTGHYQGIGAQISLLADWPVVHFPFVDGPAERAGLLPGDRVVRVDDLALTEPTDRARVVELLRGPAASEVHIGIERDGARLDTVVRRGDVQRPCVKWSHYADAAAGLGYVHLSDFHPTAAAQLARALEGLGRQGSLRGLVLDLRFDGGGSLDECLTIARTFLPSGVIATQRRRDTEIVETYEAIPSQCTHPELPLVLLVNEGSASASEVLAGALQDHRRATIVGQRTHGKAHVNTVYSWRGHDFRLKLTTGSYRTPNGHDIERHHRPDQHRPDQRRPDERGASDRSAGERPGERRTDPEQGGIRPDIVVPVDEAVRKAIGSRLAASEPPAPYAAAFAALAARHDLPVPQPPSAADDPQFAQALEALRTAVRERDEANKPK
jgi:carboxyl-terminal processing protease